jgi:hypothetical protein
MNRQFSILHSAEAVMDSIPVSSQILRHSCIDFLFRHMVVQSPLRIYNRGSIDIALVNAPPFAWNPF